MLNTVQVLNSLALKWSAKYPEHQERITKGLALALAGKVAPRTITEWRVCGSKKGVEYVVKVECGYPSCTCEDHKRRKVRCKHIFSAALMTKLAEKVEEALFAEPPCIEHRAVA